MTNFQKFKFKQITYYFGEFDPLNIREIAVKINKEFLRIAVDMNFDSNSNFEVYFFDSLAEVHDAINWPCAPKWVVGGIKEENTVLMLSPLSLEWNKQFSDRLKYQVLVHELVHCMTLSINPTLINNPRWLWEGIALYEARQFIDPKYMSGLRLGSLPTFSELNSITNTKIYDFGYTLIEFILEKWDRLKLFELIKSNGDFRQSLKIDSTEFLESWFFYIDNKYVKDKRQ